MKEVAVVIVTYHPDELGFEANLHRLSKVADTIVVYDNSEDEVSTSGVRRICGRHRATYLGGEGNVGIAEAQNWAIDWLNGLEELECIVFLDQDSSIEVNLIPRLWASYQELKREGFPVGILGAMPIREDGRYYHLEHPKRTSHYLLVDFVISSGSIVALSDLRSAGGMRGDLFIDLVDCDLSWRLRKLGKFSYIDENLLFTHTVGTGENIRFFNRILPVSAPFRHYYQIRNLFLLRKSNTLTFRMTARYVIRRVGAIVLSCVKSGHTNHRFFFMIKGIWDGLRGNAGRLNPG